MSNIPDDLKYTKSHEWVRDNGDGTATVGITDHAQELLGDLVFVELPEIDAEYGVGDECAVIESVKAASDMYSPLTGTVTEVNEALEDAPETINADAFGDGWIFKMSATSADLADLLDPADYADECED